MSNTLFVLGRQPEFGIVEIESIFPNNPIEIVNEKIISIDTKIDQNLISRLGSVTKIAEEISRTPFKNSDLTDSILNSGLVDTLANMPEGKIQFGISYHGKNQKANSIQRIALIIKREVKKTGRSIRITPNVELELSTAQVIHNHLTKNNGYELQVIDLGQEIILAKTISVQDIASYAARDQNRPFRDSRIGMLPPKLAQIMINTLNLDANSKILDPFCGTGVILQEALLMNFQAYGTDINPKMVDYADKNIQWLKSNHHGLSSVDIDLGDATIFHWKKPIDGVATEIFLGKPFFNQPPLGVINNEKTFVDDLLTKFLINLHDQIESGTKLCLAVPAWNYNNAFIQLSTLDQIEKIGYNFMSFKNLNVKDLIYYRSNQFVARQLLLLTRK
jgi:tRNA G10  N-methylase Trm11